jgi:UDP-glucose:(heptosyl)LPS alpha-1,3-glucosyltransferase
VKVALTIESFDPARGGGETYARSFARSVVSAGHEVHVFANVLGPREEGMTFHAVPPAPFNLYRRYFFATRVKELLKERQFDIIHGFGKSIYMDVFRPGGGVHRAWMEQECKAAGPGLPEWLTRLRQTLSIDDHLVLQLEWKQFVGDQGPHIIAVSRMVRDDMCRHYRTPTERITVIYNGVDLEKYRPESRRVWRDKMRRALGLDNEVALLFVGHNFRRKGLRPAIQALPMLRHRRVPFRLLVLGAGRREAYQPLIQRLKCKELVQFVGSSREPEKYYAAADLLVFPSDYDPCANVCLEALASGLPVVTSIYNGSGELITDGQEGFVVDPSNAAALAEAISHFFDPDIRRQASTAARALAETRPLSRNFREVMQVYDRVLSDKAAAEAEELESEESE